MSGTVIIDYGVGNVGAVANMLRRVGGTACISRDPETIGAADRLILPGVGSFDRAMAQLRESGVVDVITECVQANGTPLLGICLGMQILGRASEEGGAPGLGWIEADVVRFRPPPGEAAFRIPQMGWNLLRPVRADPLLEDFVHESFYLYFLHSFHLVCDDPEDVVAWTDYGYEFAAMVRVGNVWGVQGHPEKSHRFGMALFRRFLREGKRAS